MDIHDRVAKLPKDHFLSLDSVKAWIKHNEELVKEHRKDVRNKVAGAISKQASCEGYIKQMRHYLRHGDWCSDFYGKDEEYKITWITIAGGSTNEN